MTISIIAAVSENLVIGRDGDVPWHLPDDLKRFRALTTGHTVIMGRKTFESIGRPLPDRRNIVVSRSSDYRAPGATVVRSLDEALDCAAEDDTVFILGGGEIYALAFPFADRLDLTVVHATVEGDTHFPSYDADQWLLVAEEHRAPDERHALAFTFKTLTRIFDDAPPGDGS